MTSSSPISSSRRRAARPSPAAAARRRPARSAARRSGLAGGLPFSRWQPVGLLAAQVGQRVLHEGQRQRPRRCRPRPCAAARRSRRPSRTRRRPWPAARRRPRPRPPAAGPATPWRWPRRRPRRRRSGRSRPGCRADCGSRFGTTRPTGQRRARAQRGQRAAGCGQPLLHRRAAAGQHRGQFTPGQALRAQRQRQRPTAASTGSAPRHRPVRAAASVRPASGRRAGSARRGRTRAHAPQASWAGGMLIEPPSGRGVARPAGSAPMKATTTPVSSSAGARSRARMSAASIRTGPSSRQNASCQRRSGRRAGAPGAARPARRRRSGRRPRWRRRPAPPCTAGRPAGGGRPTQGARHAAAQRQQVQRPRQRQQQAGGDIGRGEAGGGQEWPASEPTAQKR